MKLDKSERPQARTAAQLRTRTRTAPIKRVRVKAGVSEPADGTPVNILHLFNRRFANPSICRILMAAMECFSSKGFHASSTRDIARKARLSPAAVYIHFRSKEDLLHTISIVAAEWALDQLLVAAKVEGTPTERLRHLVRVHVSCHAALRTAMYVANYEFQALSTKQRRQVIEIRDVIEELFARCLRDGRESGEFKIGDIRIARIAILSLCVSVLNWFSPRGAMNAHMLGDEYARLVLGMVGAPTG